MGEIKQIPEFIKSYPVLAAGASFWLPGLGQILCGKVKRGIRLLFPTLIIGIIARMPLIIQSTTYLLGGKPSMSYQYLSTLLSQVMYAILLCVQLVVRIWATYDAYKIANSLSL